MAFAGKLAMAKAYRNRENRDKDMSENVYLPAVPKNEPSTDRLKKRSSPAPDFWGVVRVR